jgi:hypothetical protein
MKACSKGKVSTPSAWASGYVSECVAACLMIVLSLVVDFCKLDRSNLPKNLPILASNACGREATDRFVSCMWVEDIIAGLKAEVHLDDSRCYHLKGDDSDRHRRVH